MGFKNIMHGGKILLTWGVAELLLLGTHKTVPGLIEELKNCFEEYNKLYFDGELDEPKVVEIVWAIQGRHILGGWDESNQTLYLARRVLFSTTIRRETLLHEMAHMKVGQGHGHDETFEREIKRLEELGAFRQFHMPRASR